MNGEYTERWAERFWDKVRGHGPDGCWEWIGAQTEDGYGRFRIGRGKYYAHRLAYLLWHGNLPEDLLVMHACDNPPCCNPRHLRLGTADENIQDRVSKGRSRGPRGQRHGSVKLSENDVRGIRGFLRSGWPHTSIARLFDVSLSTIADIANGKTWAWLDSHSEGFNP